MALYMAVIPRPITPHSSDPTQNMSQYLKEDEKEVVVHPENAPSQIYKILKMATIKEGQTIRQMRLPRSSKIGVRSSTRSKTTREYFAWWTSMFAL